MIQLRAAQQLILEYTGGRMGVIAVPGSGKTWTLSLLAAEIISSGVLKDDQEVLVVTLVNSAVQNFQQRVAAFLEAKRLLPFLGVRVRTLHGLAHDLVRERPGLVNLDDRFQILDESETDRLCKDIASSWLKAHPGFAEGFLNQDLNESILSRVERNELPGLVTNVARSYIRLVKDRRLSPERLATQLDALPMPLPLAQMGQEMYIDYQRALAYRGAVDFDDLISLALQALENDPDYLRRCQNRWPYILEDEAQDSSCLQEQILNKLVGDSGNWVRVGDPNQAIYESFTTANPQFLRNFFQVPGVFQRHLPNSGRSTLSIIQLANQLVKWTGEAHPVTEARSALQAPPWIEPAPPDDPQPNPLDDAKKVVLFLKNYSSEEEISKIADSLENWLQMPENQDKTVAVLVPTNPRAEKYVNEFSRRKIDFVDSLLRSSHATRKSAGVLRDALAYLADPKSSSKLADAYLAWRSQAGTEADELPSVRSNATLLRKLTRIEDYLWPVPDRDWLLQVESHLTAEAVSTLNEFADLARRWQKAALLPVDQLVLTLAQDLFSTPVDLALSHKLASLLRQAAQSHPNWRIPDLNQELDRIAKNERRFLGFSDDDTGFDPDQHRGKVVVATMHKAKGLEWDRVYLTSVNNYDFPSDPDTDQFFPEKYYLRDHLNLEAETIAQLDCGLSPDPYSWYQEGQATYDSRVEFIRERLRLLYVGITRARRELVVTWNTGLRRDLQPALPFLELAQFWQDLNGKEQT